MFSRQRFDDFWLRFNAVAMLVHFNLAARRRDLLELRTSVAVPHGGQESTYGDSHVHIRVRVAVDAAARLVPGSTCGTRALTMIALLAREGYPSNLRLGIRRRSDGRLAAHAWVTDASGRVISEPPEQLQGHLQVWLPAFSKTTSTMVLRE